MTIKEQISEYIENLDEIEKDYNKKLEVHIDDIYETIIKGSENHWSEFDINGIGREILTRLNKIKDLRKFLYALENFEIPLHKKILRNTLPILGIMASWLLVCATFAATITSFIAIILIAHGTLPFLLQFSFAIGTMFAGIGLSMLGCIFASNLSHYLEKQIIPIWNDNDFKQQYKKIDELVLRKHRFFEKNKLEDTINFAKNIVFNLQQPQCNISALLLKDEQELIKQLEGQVVIENNSENKQSLNAQLPLLELHNNKYASLNESTSEIKQGATVNKDISEFQMDGKTWYVRGDMSRFNKII